MTVAKRFLTPVILFFLVFSAQAQQKVVLPDVEIAADSIKKAPNYVDEGIRTIDLLHMHLEIQPDTNTHFVYGQADIYVAPFVGPINSVCLDAKGMKFNEVAIVLGGVKLQRTFKNDGQKICVSLEKTWQKEEVIHLYFDYVAMPDSLKNEGGRAITSAKGFYFIDATEDYPASFWTQGEPESNSAWFPTNDKPYEKFTHQIGITLDTAWQTLSNGFMEFQTDNGDGTKTDYWTMNQPHAPYLTMVAGGPFDTVFTEWNDKPVRYFVEKQWKNNAREIFKETHEMLDFYGELFKIPFPWQKYDQIVVRNYVSGAMENTTATVHGTSVYRDARELADKTAEDVIAHEIMHQWFGDLVTCKSWSFIPLNEGFASYGEVLWHEHKYGKDDMQWYLRSEMNGYMREYRRGDIHNIIRFDYEKPDDMFNNHSYAKAGLVIHMLRELVGDELFFASLHNYLTENEYQAVELADLRMAFEKTTGRDLRWFFDQWFLQPGHPQLEITSDYDQEKGVAILKVEQLQDVTVFPVFRLPANVKVMTRQGEKIYPIVVDQQKQTFEFAVESKPTLVKFDVENQLLAEVKVIQTDANWLTQLGKSDQAIDRYHAVQELLQTTNKNLLSTVAGIAMDDKFWTVRLEGLKSANTWDEKGKEKLKATVEGLLEDSVNAVRAAAIGVWSDVYGEKTDQIYQKNLTYNSYVVNGAALKALAKSDPKKAVIEARTGMDSTNDQWALQCTRILVGYGTADDIAFANEKLEAESPRTRLNFYALLAANMQRGGAEAEKIVNILFGVAVYDGNEGLAYYAQALLEEGTETVEELQKSATGDEAKKLDKTAKFARKKLAEIPAKN